MGKQDTYFQEAEDLYVFEGLTLENIAAQLGPDGPSITSLSNWKQKGDWSRLRAEWVAAKAGRKRKEREESHKLHETLLKILNKDELSAQDIYAATAIKRCLDQAEKKQDGTAAEFDRPAVFLENLHFVAACLKETDPEGLKVLARHFDLIVTRFKAAHAQTS